MSSLTIRAKISELRRLIDPPQNIIAQLNKLACELEKKEQQRRQRRERRHQREESWPSSSR